MNREPVLTAAAVQTAIVAIVNLLDQLNVFQLDDAQMGAINATLAAVLPLLFAVIYTRGKVTPAADPKIVTGTSVTVTNAAGATTGTPTV
jgi:hypothetical protein